MKKFKKMMALVIAMVMVLAMGVTAFADETPTTYTITIHKNETDKVAHTYGAYQIFTGKLETVGGKNVLSDIQAGSNITLATLITELNKIDGFTIAADASPAAVAKAISDKNYTADSPEAQALADAINKALAGNPVSTGTMDADASSCSISNLVAGYYLVKDTTAVTGEGAQTRYILEVVKNVDVNEKASVPSVQKKVKEKNDTTGVETSWQDAADYDIGDDVPFQITATTASTVHEYVKYHMTIQDTSSAGLDAPEKFKITIPGIEAFELANAKDESAIKQLSTTGDDGATTRVTVTVKEAGKNFKIEVAFENVTNSDLQQGQAYYKLKNASLLDSKNIVVEYTAKLNDSAVIGTPGNPNEVDMKYSNNPNIQDDSDTDEGTTPKDKVVVFTYKIKALKVEPDGAAIDQSAYDALAEADKANYVKVGDKWQKTKALNGAGFTLYKKVAAGTEGAVDGYLKIGNEITGVTMFEFKGTDAGEYKLVETTVPTGYNKAADVEFTVAATYDTEADDPKLKTLTVTPENAVFIVTTTAIEGDDQHITTNGEITGKILNESGSVLPSTGGIGTTLFYVIGTILVMGAGVLLVTRRRMSAN